MKANYTNKKEMLKSKAEIHVEQMFDKYESEIELSIENSIVYRGAIKQSLYEEKCSQPNYSVEADFTEHSVSVHGDRWCVLNFASYKHAGGGFMGGAIAQEEALCHASTLYNVIGSERFEDEYEANRAKRISPLYENFAIYSPNIIFDVNGESYNVNVITCPAPNISCYYGSYNSAKTAMKDRIKFILDIASANRQSKLILGAFGCGVFGNNPEVVAEYFAELIPHYPNITDVVFAIPDSNSKNYIAFANKFNNN